MLDNINTNENKIKIRNTSISQRWDEEFQLNVRKSAIKAGRSMTQLTIDSLRLFMRLIDCDGFLEMKPKIREDFIVALFKSSARIEGQLLDMRKDALSVIQDKQPGLIKEQVASLLTTNPGRQFSSTEIAKLLGVPQSTIRTYIRKLSLTDKRFILIEGRPNYIYFKI